MEARVFLRGRVSVVLLGVAATHADAARAAGPTKEQCIASSERGQELRSASKLRDAREQFATCVATSCPGAIREDCAQRLDDLDRAMPTVVFVVKDAANKDVAGASVSMDGRLLADGVAGTAIPVDPGDHTFVLEAGGLKAEKRLLIVEGTKERHETIVLGSAAESGESGAVVVRATPAPPVEVPTRSGPPMLSWIAFGVGGAGLAFGVIGGLLAGGKHSTLAGECDNAAGTCAPQYSADVDAFHLWRAVSTTGYIIGALGVAGGAALWLAAPKAQSTTAAHAWIGPTSAGVAGCF